MNQHDDIDACRRLLNEIAELCDHACLTGSLSSGAKRTAQRYNSVLERLIQAGDVPEGIFTLIPEDSDFGEIGVEARMLASYFQRNKEKDKEDRGEDNDRNILIRLAPFVRQEDLGILIREQRRNGTPFDMGTLTSLAPFLGQDTLGELLRDHLSKAQKPHPTVQPDPVVVPSPVSTEPVAAPRPAPSPTGSSEPRITTPPVSEAKETMDELLTALNAPSLPDHERSVLIDKIRRLSS